MISYYIPPSPFNTFQKEGVGEEGGKKEWGVKGTKSRGIKAVSVILARSCARLAHPSRRRKKSI